MILICTRFGSQPPDLLPAQMSELSELETPLLLFLPWTSSPAKGTPGVCADPTLKKNKIKAKDEASLAQS